MDNNNLQALRELARKLESDEVRLTAALDALEVCDCTAGRDHIHVESE